MHLHYSDIGNAISIADFHIRFCVGNCFGYKDTEKMNTVVGSAALSDFLNTDDCSLMTDAVCE